MTPAAARLARLRIALRLGEPWALRQLRDALRANHGSLRGATRALGVSEALLGLLRAEVPAVRAVTDQHAQGRMGAARMARKAKADKGSQ
jgi:hypothetical protein